MYIDDDGIPWYVGKGCKYRSRHYNSCRLDKEFPRPDKDKNIVIVKENLTEAAAYALEVELIAKHKRQSDGGTLVNKCLGGPGATGFKHKPNRASSMKGKKHSEDSKKKMSESAKKRGATKACTYIITDKDGNHTVVTNLAAYCREHNLNRNALTNVLCGRSKSHKGLTISKSK